MHLVRKIIHKIIQFNAKSDYLYFKSHLNNVHKVQENILSHLLRNLNDTHPAKLVEIDYASFSQLPVTEYKDWHDHIMKQKSGHNDSLCRGTKHYQPTSGSSQHIKWIPYNKELTKQMDRALNVWLYDLYKKFPKLIDGKHYWSMSWIPTELRGQMQSNDAGLFNPIKSFLLNRLLAVPEKVSHLPSSDDSLYYTVKHLINQKDLSLISVWSPTFLMTLINVIFHHREKLLNDRILKKQKNILLTLKKPHDIYKLWPNLQLISSWDTASSKDYAKELREYFPHTSFQGKGLWATEGVVTIPFKNEYYLAYTSHFYEFENYDTKEIKRAHELSTGEIVSPIISTPNGILRYKLNDRVQVTGLHGQCPTLVFLGRDQSVDLVGEKISNAQAEKILQKTNGRCLMAIKKPQVEKAPYYALLCDDSNKTDIDQSQLENMLLENFHYKLARDLDQLGPARYVYTKGPLQLYKKLCLSKGMVLGNIKVEPLTLLESDELIYDKLN